MSFRLVVLISGRGSNLQSLIDACSDDAFPADIALVISNKPGVQGLERASAAGIATAVVNHKDYASREDFDRALDAAIAAAEPDLVCLAGFMRILTNWFATRWRDRLINIHPSLLPSFKGAHAHEQVAESGVRFTGCTIHYVRPEMDAGPVIAQAVVPVHPGDDADAIAARVLEQEHVLYPLAVKLIAEGRVRVAAERVVIEDDSAPVGAMVSPTA
ncbi:MAG: phosphoribosylglycinamide formyltransferase [Rhodospirillales bacterium]